MHSWGSCVLAWGPGMSCTAAQSPVTCMPGRGACSPTSSSLLSIRALIGLMPEPVAKMKQVGNCCAGARSGRKPLPITAVTSILVPAAPVRPLSQSLGKRDCPSLRAPQSLSLQHQGSLSQSQEGWEAVVSSRQPAQLPPACWGDCLGIAAWLTRGLSLQNGCSLNASGALQQLMQWGHQSSSRPKQPGRQATCSFACDACKTSTAPFRTHPT